MRLLLAFSSLLVLLFAACSGGGNGDKTGTAAPQAAVTSSADSTPSDDTGITPSAGETPGASATDPFADLQSYRYQMNLTAVGATSVTVKGAVKAPDSISLDFYLGESDTPVNSMIIIGSQAWSKSSITGQWEQVDVAEAEGEVAGLLPKDFWGDFPMDKITSVSSNMGEEAVNDIKATHYQISEASGDTLAEIGKIFGSTDEGDLPEKFSMDLWVAVDGNWPAKATISATFPPGSEITQASIAWEVSDANSSAISIQPPL